MASAFVLEAINLEKSSSALRIAVPLGGNASTRVPFFLCDGFTASHVLDVGNANVRDYRNVGSSQRRQRRDFTRVIHANLEYSNLIAGSQLQHR
jgi:hypothetical protein